ncbi:MAG: hypothetical protein HC769_37900 [Cyanobacteria bacterium CRU_2_1]|nr:hypothetical protein [Cyanobacteria bacterium CRU_2_1]
MHFSRGNHQQLNVNPTLQAISLRRPRSAEEERAVELAISLRDKGLLTQSFPVLRAIFVSLSPILFFLIFAEVNRPKFESFGINVSSANNVILMGVTGVMLGLSFLTMIKHKTRLTWIGEKLCKGANSVISKTET